MRKLALLSLIKFPNFPTLPHPFKEFFFPPIQQEEGYRDSSAQVP